MVPPLSGASWAKSPVILQCLVILCAAWRTRTLFSTMPLPYRSAPFTPLGCVVNLYLCSPASGTWGAQHSWQILLHLGYIDGSVHSDNCRHISRDIPPPSFVLSLIVLSSPMLWMVSSILRNWLSFLFFFLLDIFKNGRESTQNRS